MKGDSAGPRCRHAERGMERLMGGPGNEPFVGTFGSRRDFRGGPLGRSPPGGADARRTSPVLAASDRAADERPDRGAFRIDREWATVGRGHLPVAPKKMGQRIT